MSVESPLPLETTKNKPIFIEPVKLICLGTTVCTKHIQFLHVDFRKRRESQAVDQSLGHFLGYDFIFADEYYLLHKMTNTHGRELQYFDKKADRVALQYTPYDY